MSAPSPDVNRQYVLLQRPKGPLSESDFEYREGPVPEPGPGEVLARTLYLSIDPANRAWITDGQLRIQEDILDGLDQAPGALVGVLHGDNTGKRLVRVAPGIA